MKEIISFNYYRKTWGGVKEMQEEILRRLKTDARTMDDHYNCFSVRSSIFRDSEPIFFLTYIRPEVMDVLIYAILKQYDDIASENVPVLSHLELVDILVHFGLALIVRDTHLPENINDFRNFDLEDNWNIWSDYNDEVFSLLFFETMNWNDLQEYLYNLSWTKENSK